MISDPEKMESWFQHYLEKIKPKALDKIEESKMIALAIISDFGYVFRKPYNYFDKYIIDGDSYYFLDSSKYKTCRALAEDTNYNTWCMLPELIRRIEKKPTREREPLFIAASILEYCYEAQPRMEGRYTEYTQDRAMDLQHAIERIDKRPFEEAASIGRAKVEWGGGELGRRNLGTERAFTKHVREVISFSAKNVPPGTLTAEDVLNNFEHYEGNDRFEFISLDGKKFNYCYDHKAKSSTIRKLISKINRLIKNS